MSDDPYAILGVERSATEEQIRKAYRDQAKQCHPDVGGSEERFEAIAQAVQILSDPDARAHYDRTGEMKGKTIDNGDNAAIGRIASALASILEQSKHEPVNTDVVATLLALINADIAEGNKHLAKCKASLKRAEKVRGRFRRKEVQATRKAKKKGAEPPKRDFMGLIVDNQIIQSTRQIDKIEAQLKPLLRAVEILSEYEFNSEIMDTAGDLLAAQAMAFKTFRIG
jgi:curved DNA-binding protein CbpA